jgi:Outer membrane protein
MKKTIIILSYILFSMYLCAQDKNQEWTLRRCIRYAIQNNVSVKQIEQAKADREVSLDMSKKSWLPSVSANIGQNIDVGRSPSKDGTIKDQSSTNSSFYLQTSMPLFEGLKIRNDIKAQVWNVLAATENLNKAIDDVSVNVFSYYMQVLFKREIENVAQEQILLCMNQLKRTETLVENGKIAKSQLYDMEAQLAKDKVTHTKAKNDVSLALLDLMQAMDLNIEESEFEIALPKIDEIVIEYMKGILSPDMIYDEAASYKPEIKKQEYLLESSMRTLDIAKSGFFPRLSLNASYGNYYYHYTGFENASFSDQWDQNSRKTIGMTLSIPIFNRFQVRNNVRSAQIAITNQKLAIEEAHKTLYKEIKQAYVNAVAAKELYFSAETSVKSSHKAFQYAEESYNAGKTSVFEYNEAKTKYIQSLSEQKQAKFDFIFRCKILDFYSGVPISL